MFTVKFNHTAHKQMWNDIANKVVPDKYIWCEIHLYNKVHFDCFACDYAVEKAVNTYERCRNCPLIWPIDTKTHNEILCSNEYDNSIYFKRIYENTTIIQPNMGLYGMYEVYNDCVDDRQYAIAKMIADLPVKHGVVVV